MPIPDTRWVGVKVIRATRMHQRQKRQQEGVGSLISFQNQCSPKRTRSNYTLLDA